jgi:hypothetical protein
LSFLGFDRDATELMRSETMSSGTQVDLDWAGADAGQRGAGAPTASAPNGGAAATAYLTDEEILGIDPPAPNGGFGGLRNDNAVATGAQQNATAGAGGPAEAGAVVAKTTQAEACATGGMPSWMQAVAADPKHGGEAQLLWREHQEFRAAFSSPEEARAIKELLPGGVRDVLTLREATQSVDRIDAAIFSGDARAQSEVVAELARANPAAFRSMFAEAAKVLAGMGRKAEVGGLRLEVGNFANTSPAMSTVAGGESENRRRDVGAATEKVGSGESPVTSHPSQDLRASQSPVTTHESQITNHESPHFDPAAYANFERATNDAVARDVRGAIGDTLARVMPEGVAEGAARRIGEDIFNEVHRALAADRNLSEQVAGVLRDRRFGGAEQQRVASLLAGRAKQLVPSVARRVIGEWTSTVLNTARSKAARQAAAAARVDIAAPGGSLDSMPLRSRGAGSAREVNYASMSDEEILNS